MLVLTRKQKEVIKIGDNITVTIMRVHGQTVRVGIDAPRDVRVMRGELLERDLAAANGEITVNEDVEPHPQVIQFRFTPQERVVPASSSRGPLASFLPSLHTAGALVEAVNQ